MSSSPLRAAIRRGAIAVSVAALAVAAVPAQSQAATVQAAPAALAAAVDPPPPTVTADSLPSWQVNGVVWSQAIIGDVVYVTGSFTRARPPGVAAGGAGEVVANNIFAYQLSTGARVAGFATNPGLNAQGLVIRASLDNTRLYVGGDFTTAAGQTRGHIAALNPATGAAIAGFAPNIGGQVRGLGITASTVHAGGNFTSANGIARTRLAAFQTSNGAMTSWAPAAAGGYVWTMTMSPDRTRVIPGGSFTTLAGQAAYGMGSINLDGTINPWPAQEKIRTAGANGAITALKSDATQVYGTSYAFGAGAAYEGTFALDPMTGQINWQSDCLGDTYDIAPVGQVLYNVSHQHDCTVIGSFPDTNPRVRWQKAGAQTTYPTGVQTRDDVYGWASTYGLLGTAYAGNLHWYPNFAFGSYTSARQAGWAIDTSPDGQWVVVGGEFPRVNGVAQQGITRFRTKAGAPNKVGPSYSTVPATPTPTTSAVSLSAGEVRVSFGTAWDYDDEELTYEVLRNNNTWVDTQKVKSNFWTLPRVGFIDKGLTPGSSVRYQVRITDSSGNILWSPVSNTVTVGTGAASAYATSVRDDGAEHLWRLGESSGATVLDYAAFDDATLSGGYTRGQAGAIIGESDGSTAFNGSDGYAVNSAPVDGPNVFSVEAWFRTTTTSGGKIVGFGNNATGTSTNYDRHIYMSPNGRVTFGVYNNGMYTVSTPGALNDGQWHHVVGTMGPAGLTFYADGRKVGANGGTSAAQPYQGYWRIGGDSPWDGNAYFAGDIDEVALYPTTLPVTAVQDHYRASGRTLDVPTRPTDAYGQAVWDANPDLYWRLGDTNGVAKDSGPNESNGIYQGGYTQGQTGAFDGATNKAVAFNGNDGFVASNTVYSNPRTYSLESWFKTTSTSGGKIIGFGCSQTGTSGCYDRHVYLNNDGRLTFGVWTGFTNTITTDNAVNDGQWHHVVATQNTTEGMKLYVDGVLVGTNGQTDAQAYDGFWRVGGDNHWGCCSPFLAATIDEAAVYSSVLSPATVSDHFAKGGGAVPNQAPNASFTHTEDLRTVSVNASASTDGDGTIASYSWNWGDGSSPTTGTSATASHTYETAGAYTVTLTVTDNDGATDTETATVTATDPPPNQVPTAAFTHTESNLTVNVNGSTSTDGDGTIASYSWNFGDGSPAVTTPTASHTYAAAGDYTVTLTVTDDDGATDTETATVTVTAPPPNQAPTAAFTHTENNLAVSVNGSGSTDADGTIASYSWSWGDGTPDTTGATATANHTYTTAGSKTVTLTVTDDDGATDSETATFTVTAPPANQAPTAAFTTTVNDLVVSVNGSGSTDTDGTIASYSWNWGDGTPATTGASATATHTYGSAGAYTITLTVTDDDGATDTETASVTTTAPPFLARDDFGRTVANGWGTADVGGAWTVGGPADRWSVNAGVGSLSLNAGNGYTASLNALSVASSDVSFNVGASKVATGGGQYISLIGRRVAATTDYRAKVQLAANGTVSLWLARTVSGTETLVPGGGVVSGLTAAAGDRFEVRMQAVGSSPTTLRAKIWKSGTTEPAAWTRTGTDSTAGLQVAGGVGMYSYLSGSTTNSPVVFTIDGFRVRTP
ncbi:PKD domain-containing protein [Oryzobacter terrae]|uniref:PKD domain-containing protein n=1 Tax=Oryzobacter terrae TaxID=1620385 RepID=UPI00366A6410